jgi:hypothetical protein
MDVDSVELWVTDCFVTNADESTNLARSLIICHHSCQNFMHYLGKRYIIPSLTVKAQNIAAYPL